MSNLFQAVILFGGIFLIFSLADGANAGKEICVDALGTLTLLLWIWTFISVMMLRNR